jgi:GH18 family chitinase
VAADTANFVIFLKELKAACGSKYGISATLPSSYWYLQGFDIVGMSDYVDTFNFMSYDMFVLLSCTPLSSPSGSQQSGTPFEALAY